MNKSLNLSFGASNGEVLPVNESQLRAATRFKDALRLCVKLSRVKRTQADLALQADIHPTQFSKILHSNFHLPGDSIALIEKLCGNTAITQWLALQHGAQVKFETQEEKIARLEAELARRAA